MLILVLRFQVCNSWIVSILASCGRLPAIVPDLASRPRQLVFLTPVDSQLNDFLNEIHQIAIFEPSIMERIDEDLDLHAKKKKLQRLADEQFLAGQTPDLPAPEPADSFPQWQSARSSQAQEGVFPVTAPSAQTAQTVAARSGVGSPEPGGPHRSATESASEGRRSPVPRL